MLTTASPYFLYWKTTVTICFVCILLSKLKKPSIMKKRSIHKLKLRKAAVSNLNTTALTGGTIGGTLFCQSVNICETIDFTRCNGELNCRIYDRNER